MALQDDLKQRETCWSMAINQLKERIETLEYENPEVKQEKEIIECNRIDLMHSLQIISKQSHDDPSSSIGMHFMPRKSLVELQQSERPKPTVSSSSSASNSPIDAEDGSGVKLRTIGEQTESGDQ